MQAAEDGKRRENLPTESALEIAETAAQAASAAAADAAQVQARKSIKKNLGRLEGSKAQALGREATPDFKGCQLMVSFLRQPMLMLWGHVPDNGPTGLWVQDLQI